MDVRQALWLTAVVVALCACGNALSLPQKRSIRDAIEPSELENTLSGKHEPEHEHDERATWLDTREVDPETVFKLRILNAIKELAQDGAVNPAVLRAPSGVKKRGRWQGFCFRRTRTGRFLPYICWKGDMRVAEL